MNRLESDCITIGKVDTVKLFNAAGEVDIDQALARIKFRCADVNFAFLHKLS
jgi:hypothetical protein